jgi:tRNA dimethylallyltransferase
LAETGVWLIAGPTASGKSGLALALAEATGAEIVNADSMQVYADLRVLTARPGPDELARAPHRLDGVADGAEAWSVGRWLRAATQVLAEIAARGRLAIVVGGTGLYFRALTRGLADIPPVPEESRAAAEAEYHAEGEGAFRMRLAVLDPAAAARIAPGDRQRLVRAMAVARATGRALSDWQAGGETPALDNWRGLVLDPPRAALYARCDARLAAMVEEGALDEVAALMTRGLDPALPVMKALGVPEFAGHLRGEASLEEALAAARQATRRYAKRQTTWFRNQTADWPRLTPPDPTAALALLEAR